MGHQNLYTQLFSICTDQAWIFLEPPAAQDSISLTIFQNLIGELPRINAAHTPNEHLVTNRLLHQFGEVYLIPGYVESFGGLRRGISTGGDIEEVNTVLRKKMRESHSVFDSPRRLIW